MRGSRATAKPSAPGCLAGLDQGIARTRRMKSRGEMDPIALRLGIDALNAAYADCIDDDRLEEWPDFFVEQGRYLITDRESHRAGLHHGVIYCASRDMAIDRVMATRRVLMYEPHRYRHIVGPARVDQVEGGVAETRANFLAVR